MLTTTHMSGIKKIIPYLRYAPVFKIDICPELKGEPGHKKSKTFIDIICAGFFILEA